MPDVIDFENMPVDDLPGVWTPVQWELTESEKRQELETQSTASLLWAVDPPEAILRMLLGATDIQRALEPPPGFNPEEQGEWDPTLVTFTFREPIRLVSAERAADSLNVEYDFGPLGHWLLTFKEGQFTAERV